MNYDKTDLNAYKAASLQLNWPFGELTLDSARFRKALRDPAAPGKEKVSRSLIHDELFERRGFGYHAAQRLIEVLLEGPVELQFIGNTIAAGYGLIPRFSASFGYSGQNIVVEGNTETGAIIAVYHWYWNRHLHQVESV